ncbi:class I SAM-dependent DNA methyltransferase [Chryseobacterium sp. KLBC 52]|uniref:HsdM family class I SAM-dependent methyltransferase n=1 Tax=Chryseobacterium sp. KLBC 52 TaxID=1862702 RepID=UPI000E0B4EA1|nr:class I SAM-dependent DNA methyltransferase [Chryseobacterium sp. KLBC 52]
MLSQEIKNKVQLLWDRLWGGGLSNPITAIENISYLIFMKRLEKFHPTLPSEFKWGNYNALKGSDLKRRIDEVFLFIQNDLGNETEPFALEMKKAKFGISTPSLLEDAVGIVDEIFKLIEKEEEKNQHFQDIQGDVYEYLLKATNEAGKNGQFRTPRHIIQMMAELVSPDIIDPNTKICDVTSGSSGFLVGSYQYILKENSKYIDLDEENHLEKGLDGKKLAEKDIKRLKEQVFYGFDIDETMVRIGMMNMMMHGIEKPHISHLNTLSSEYENFFQKARTAEHNIDNLISGNLKATVKHASLKVTPKDKENLWGQAEYNYILANPPFAAKVNSKSISKNLNRIYEIKEDAKKAQTLQTELLFLERIMYMLKIDGRAAVIVPEGVLFNSGKVYKRTREIILRDCDLQAVISLPSGVFNPYTAVKTSILLFTKKEFNSKKYHTKKVWFYGMESDGYTLDTSRKKISNDYPLPETISEFKKKDETASSQKDRTKKHFYVDLEEIEENGLELNFNLYRDFVFEDQNYEPPRVILQKLVELEKTIGNGVSQLFKLMD